MRKITIHEPIWNGRKIGVADYKITDDLEIEIDYKTTSGERLYPNPFYISKEAAICHPIQVVKGIELRIIPIRELITH